MSIDSRDSITGNQKDKQMQEQIARMLRNPVGYDNTTVTQLVGCSLGIDIESCADMRNSFYPDWTDEDFSLLLERLSSKSGEWKDQIDRIKKYYSDDE